MTRTGPADVVMPACRRTAPARRVPARPASRELASRELASRRPATGAPAIVRAVFPRGESFKPAVGSSSVLARRATPPRLRAPAHPLNSYLLKRPAAALSGCSFDPGRDMLCILTSPPQWLQWP